MIPQYDYQSDSTKIIINECNKAFEKVGKSIEKRKFRESLNHLMNLAKFGNQFLDKNQPWKKIKEDKKQAGEILSQSLIIVSAISCLLEPFLPSSAYKLQKILFDKKQNPWELIIPASGSKFKTPEPLFQKLDEEIVSMENEKIKHEQN